MRNHTSKQYPSEVEKPVVFQPKPRSGRWKKEIADSLSKQATQSSEPVQRGSSGGILPVEDREAGKRSLSRSPVPADTALAPPAREQYRKVGRKCSSRRALRWQVMPQLKCSAARGSSTGYTDCYALTNSKRRTVGVCKSMKCAYAYSVMQSEGVRIQEFTSRG
jgi:hypothetical protein